MITKDNFTKVLESLGFTGNTQTGIWSKHFRNNIDCVMEADIINNKPIYPIQVESDSDTTRSFIKPESYVVFVCVALLLAKGYRPEHIVLEKKWQLGHSAKSGRADITVYDESGSNILLIIECKRAGKDYTEARKLLFEGKDDLQLFSYLAQARSTKWLQLFAADYVESEHEIKIFEEIIKTHDDENVIILANQDASILLYKEASQAEDLYRVWDETYGKKTYKGLIWGEDTTAYNIGVKPLRKKDLRKFDVDDGITNHFLEILRHNSISDKENAFNKLLSLFICKMVDENKAENEEVDFQYKEGVDNYFTLYERLLHLFHRGMDEFLKEEVFYLEDNYISLTLKQYTGKQRKNLEDELRRSFQKTKLLSCQVFAFKEIYNEKLFLQNGKILVEMVELFQNYKLSYTSRKAFLGDLFEDLLNQGFKQDEGQFFTPMPITRFIWNSIPYEKFINFKATTCPKVIDFACGAGHFLTEGIAAISEAFKNKGINNITDSKISASFYGIEKDNRLSRVSKVALLLNGANEAHIKAMDGLDHDISFLGEKNTFDILVANPPYAVDAFKEHLEKKILNNYDILKHMSLSSDNIEYVFVERISQLLAPHGVAGIVLPESILTADDYAGIKTREILLKDFYIRCITCFEGKTFSKTPTTTVVLFLEKRETTPRNSILLKDSIEAIFTTKDLSDWEDESIYTNYLKNNNISREVYDAFRLNTYSIETLKNDNYFSQFIDAFFSDPDTISIQGSSKFRNLSKQKQNKELKDRLYKKLVALESEKIYYFALTDKQNVLVIKAPIDVKEQKNFLGYKSSIKKGKEGISEYEGSLTNSKDRYAKDKLAWCVKNVFENSFVNNKEAQKYSIYMPLSRFIYFSKVKFNKIIYNVPVSSFDLKSIYPIKTVGELMLDVVGNKTKIDADSILTHGSLPVITQEKERFISGYTNNSQPINDLPLIVFGDHSCSFKFIDFEFVRGADGTQLIKVDESIIKLKYLYYYLSSIEVHNSGKYERHFKYLKEVQVPIPPIDTGIQDLIIKDCEKIEAQYKSSRMSIKNYQTKLQTLFIKNKIFEL